MAAFQVPSVFTAIDKFSRPVQKMQRAGTRFASSVRGAVARADATFVRFGRTIKNTLGTFGLFIGLTAGLSVIGGAINIIADYEQANANLASILGVNVDQTFALQSASKQLGATTAFTAAEVAGLQTEFAKLGFTQKEILGATEGTLALAAATKTELPQAASQVGAAIRAFGLDASEAGRVADVFAASTSKSALDMSKLDVAMSKVAPVAKQFGFSIEDTTAIMGTLSNAGFDASTMATSTRSILLNLADANGKLAKQLGKPARNFEDITSAMVTLQKRGIGLGEMLDSTDKRSVAAFATLLEGSEKTKVLQAALKDAGGAAQEMADKQLNTLQGRATILNSAYQGFILSLDEGNGKFSTAAKRVLEVATEILSLASGMAVAKEELTGTALANRVLAERIIWVIKVVAKLTAGYLALKLVMFTMRKVQLAYNIVLGITNALQGKSLIGLRANSVAMMTSAKVTKLGASAMRIFGIATKIALGPIGLIILGITALILGVRQMIKNWNTWGQVVALLMGPLGMIIFIIKSIADRWGEVKAAFADGGIIGAISKIGEILRDALVVAIAEGMILFMKLVRAVKQALPRALESASAGFKKLGFAILDFLLKPIQRVLELTSKIGIGTGALENIKEQRGVIKDQKSAAEQAANRPSFFDEISEQFQKRAKEEGLIGGPVNIAATRESLQTERSETISNQRLGIDINDRTAGRVDIDQSGVDENIDVQTQKTGTFD